MSDTVTEPTVITPALLEQFVDGAPDNIGYARQFYPAVVNDLRQNDDIAQCHAFAIQSESLSSLARKNDELRKVFDRIQARAVRRCGELLHEIPDVNRGRPPKEIREGALPNLGRSKVAEDAGLSEHQRKTALHVANVPEEDFEELVESDKPPTVTKLAKLGAPPAEARISLTGYVTLDEWNILSAVKQQALLSDSGTKGFIRQKSADIEWANWSWNYVTGCYHKCPYCYARDDADRWYPPELGFKPAIWPARRRAPVDRQPKGDGAGKNIFACSMADLFGRWVPNEWIETVFQTVRDSPQWNFLFLTKFPQRMSEFDIPKNCWMGTTVDLQARVANAEKAFAAVNCEIRWLSLEPMLEPLKFSNLELFDWVVIGGSSPSRETLGSVATPEYNIPLDWLIDVYQQARAAKCAVYFKTNSGLFGDTRLREYPGVKRVVPRAPEVFNYLRKMPAKERIG